MRPVEQAIRARFSGPETLFTTARHKPFRIDRIDARGVVLQLGRQKTPTRFGWDCLEGVVPFLRPYPGWVEAGGTYTMAPTPDTLDEYLKGCVARSTSRWVAVVLHEAGVVELDPGRPLRLRLVARFLTS